MKRFEREEGVAFYNAEEDEEEKTKKLKRKETSKTETCTTTLARFLARENEDKFAVQNPSSAQKTSLIHFECEERWKTVRDAVVEGVLTRAEQFFLFQNKNEEFLSLTKGVVPSGFDDDDDDEDEDDDFEDEDVENHRSYRGGGGGHSERRITHMLSFAMVDVACAAVDFAEEVVRAFASGECTTESAWAYEVLSASCFRLSLKTRERRDQFDVDYEQEMCEEEKKNNFSVPISTITFDKETMAKMETVILTTLEYRVSKPTRSMWAMEFLNAMKKNVEIVAFGTEGARPKEFKRLWTKAEEHACVIVAASLRSFPTSPQFRASAIGAAAATLGVALSAFEYLREEEEEEEDGKEEEGKQQKRERQHAAFVSDVKKLVKATAVNAFDFGSWEREFEIAFVSFSRYHHHHHLFWDRRRDRRNNKAPLPPRRGGGEEEKMAPADNKEKEEKEDEERIVVS